MASNTKILIKRSQDQSIPNGLLDGELAYSYASNTLFIGNANTMSGYNVIGGQGLLESLSANLSLTDANSNTANINLSTDALKITGSDVISVNLIDDLMNGPYYEVSMNASTFMRANTGSTFETQVISTNLQVDGDLIVNGTTTTINSTQVSTGDTILLLANNNTSGDTVDTGFVSRYNDGSSNLFSGLVRDSSVGHYALFKDVDSSMMMGQFTGVDISTLDANETMSGMPGGKYATLHAKIESPSVTASTLRTGSSTIVLGGNTEADSYGVAIGYNAAANTGSIMPGIGGEAVAIGYNAGHGVTSGSKSVAIGSSAQATAVNGIAIGPNAQASGQDGMGTTGSIVLNADGMNVLTSSQHGFFVNPVREVAPEDFDVYDGIAMYNSSTKEFRYTHTLDGGTF